MVRVDSFALGPAYDFISQFPLTFLGAHLWPVFYNWARRSQNLCTLFGCFFQCLVWFCSQKTAFYSRQQDREKWYWNIVIIVWQTVPENCISKVFWKHLIFWKQFRIILWILDNCIHIETSGSKILLLDFSLKTWIVFIEKAKNVSFHKKLKWDSSFWWANRWNDEILVLGSMDTY